MSKDVCPECGYCNHCESRHSNPDWPAETCPLDPDTPRGWIEAKLVEEGFDPGTGVKKVAAIVGMAEENVRLKAERDEALANVATLMTTQEAMVEEQVRLSRLHQARVFDLEAVVEQQAKRIADLEAAIKSRDETTLHDAALFGAKLAEAQERPDLSYAVLSTIAKHVGLVEAPLEEIEKAVVEALQREQQSRIDYGDGTWEDVCIERDDLKAEVTQLHADAAVDPEGACTCDDEGACGWCLFKRVEELSSAIETAQGHLNYDITEEPEKRVDAVVWNANMKAGQALREAGVPEGASMTFIRPIGVDGSGELEFKIQIDNREASIWLSREMWDAFATFWDTKPDAGPSSSTIKGLVLAFAAEVEEVPGTNCGMCANLLRSIANNTMGSLPDLVDQVFGNISNASGVALDGIAEVHFGVSRGGDVAAVPGRLTDDIGAFMRKTWLSDDSMRPADAVWNETYGWWDESDAALHARTKDGGQE